MKLHEEILKLTEYGVQKNLIAENDRIYTINRFLEIFCEDSIHLDEQALANIKNAPINLEETLNTLTTIAFEKGLIENDGITQRDLFDTKLMGVLTKKPSEIIGEFWDLYKENPKKATDFFYNFSQDVNYIRKERVKKDKKWMVDSKYGKIDISINLSKPEKDPKAIAAARNQAASSYPKCQLCIENEGYAGRINHPARQNHRIIPIEVGGGRWGFQYSPYVYYNEHCIVLNSQHIPMKIDRSAFEKLFDFVELFPHYFVGSNADLPIVGGSILSHEHFQGGSYVLPMERAEIEKHFSFSDYEDLEVGILNWPLSVIRIKGKNRKKMLDLAEHILDTWRGYTDEDAYIFAETDGEPHNTITPIARMKNGFYELDLTLRNNITTESYPLGLYHPHQEYHHIKKENIGLIEVMGLAILPARLKSEMDLVAECLIGNKNIEDYEELLKHKAWAEDILKSHPELCKENVHKILQNEIGHVFVKVLEDAGVYKCTPDGRAAFERFINTL
ncbi:MAG: UDP-glucose--hexose-1-phosphate uridylyltransferase [Clostridia bacterium]|nr:UDP-glucose--hexose-1-phosphate uridylyltransferase [Clostridia bacterium]